MKFGEYDQFLMRLWIDKALTMDSHSDAAYCCILPHRAAYHSITLKNTINVQNLFYGSCLRATFSLSRNIDYESTIGQREMGKRG